MCKRVFTTQNVLNLLTSLHLTRSWSPGAKDNIFNDLRYIWGGFAYLQDMLDSGVARAHGSTPLVGVYAQQMPYPCYVNDG